MCDRLIQLSFAKIVNSKNERGGAKLRKNLLILRLLQNARNEIKFRSLQCQKSDDIPVNCDIQNNDNSDSTSSCENENSKETPSFDNNSVVDNCENLSPTSSSATNLASESQDKNLPISNNEVITDQSRTQNSSSTFGIKRKLSGVDNEQLSNNHKKQCLSQSVIVGNCQMSCPPVVVMQFVCST